MGMDLVVGRPTGSVAATTTSFSPPALASSPRSPPPRAGCLPEAPAGVLAAAFARCLLERSQEDSLDVGGAVDDNEGGEGESEGRGGEGDEDEEATGLAGFLSAAAGGTDDEDFADDVNLVVCTFASRASFATTGIMPSADMEVGDVTLATTARGRGGSGSPLLPLLLLPLLLLPLLLLPPGGRVLSGTVVCVADLVSGGSDAGAAEEEAGTATVAGMVTSRVTGDGVEEEDALVARVVDNDDARFSAAGEGGGAAAVPTRGLASAIALVSADLTATPELKAVLGPGLESALGSVVPREGAGCSNDPKARESPLPEALTLDAGVEGSCLSCCC